MSFLDSIKEKIKKAAIMGGIVASTTGGQAQAVETQPEENNEQNIEQVASFSKNTDEDFLSKTNTIFNGVSPIAPTPSHQATPQTNFPLDEPEKTFPESEENSARRNNLNSESEPLAKTNSPSSEPKATTEDVVEVLSNPEYMGEHVSAPTNLNEDNSISLENGQTVIQDEKNPNNLHILDNQGNEDSSISIKKDSEDNLTFTKLYNQREEDDWIVDASRQDTVKQVQADGTVVEIQENGGVVNQTLQKPDGSTQKFTEVDGRLTYEETRNADGTWNATRHLADGTDEYFEKTSEGNSIKRIYDAEGNISKEFINGELVGKDKNFSTQEEQESAKQSEDFREENSSNKEEEIIEPTQEKEKNSEPITPSQNFYEAGEDNSLTNKVEQVSQPISQAESSSLQKNLEKLQVSGHLHDILGKSSQNGDIKQNVLLKQKMKENE